MTTFPNCRANHGLVAFKTPEDGYFCDVCDTDFNADSTLFGCRQCNYDICSFCQTRSEQLAKEYNHKSTSSKQYLEQISNLMRLQNQCKMSKDECSQMINNKLSPVINPLCSQLDTMIDDMIFMAMVCISHQINESNISLFLDGIKCDYIPIILKCLKKIYTFIRDSKSNSHIADFISSLLTILNRSDIFENEELIYWVIHILSFKMDHVIDELANPFAIRTCLKFVNHPNIKLCVKERCIFLLYIICCKSITYRDLCLKENILNSVGELCSATNYSIKLLESISLLYLTIIQKHDTLPDKKYIMLMLRGMSVLINYEYDTILKPIIKAYYRVAENGDLMDVYVADILDGTIDGMVIKKQYQQKLYDDDKLFTKSMKKYQKECGLHITGAITGLIREHYDIFTQNTIETTNYSDLFTRLFDLLDYKNQSVVWYALMTIYYLTTSSTDLINRLIELGITQSLKILVQHKNKEIQTATCWLAERLAENNQFNKLIEDEVIHSILLGDNCNKDGVLVILRGMEEGGIDGIKLVFDDNQLLTSMFNVLSTIFINDEICSESILQELKDSLKSVVRSIFRNNAPNHIIQKLLNKINELQNNEEIVGESREYLVSLKGLIERWIIEYAYIT
eukprot:106994_1